MGRKLGKTGHSVNSIGLGAWQLSNTGRPSDADGVELIRAAIEAGIDLIDTADCYCADDREFGHNEKLVKAGVAASGRDDVLVATKVGIRRPNGAWQPDGRPESIKRCCEESLRRLNVDTVFLYQLHTPDPQVPIEESVGAMRDLQTQGKIRHIGLSNVNRDELRRAEDVARIETVQNECNPWVRGDVDSALVDYCAEREMAFLPFHPVGGKDRHAALAKDSLLSELADKYQCSTYCVLLSWLLGLGPHVIPIPGATRLASVTDSLRASSFVLDAHDQSRLGQV